MTPRSKKFWSSTRAALALGLGLALAVPLAATQQTVTAPAAQAGIADWLYFGDGEAKSRPGANGAVRANGTITYVASCPVAGGIGDFVFPVADIYVVRVGTVQPGSKLVNADGTAPSTVIGLSSGAFIDELLAITGPSGGLGTGSFDVVFDNCQDGTYEPGIDSLHPAAVFVEYPPELQHYASWVGDMKLKAAESAASWVYAVELATAYDKAKNYKDPKALVGAILGAPTSFLQLIDKLVGFSKLKDSIIPPTPLSGARNLMAAQAKHYLAIAEDPPDHDYQQHTVITPIETELSTADFEATAAIEDVAAPLATEGALAEAFLHSLERYQGATYASDAEWALVHARELQHISLALADANEATLGEISEWRDAFAEFDGYADNLFQEVVDNEELGNSRFTADERRTLMNLGLSAAEMTEVRTLITDPQLDGELKRARNAVLDDRLGQLETAQQQMADELRLLADRLDAEIAALVAQESVPQTKPVADAGGPYSVTAGGDLSLDAGGSTPGSGGGITDYAWDTDGDGAFDDASGVSASVALGVGAPGVVGLRITAADGGESVAYAPVSVERADRPTIANRLPDHRFITAKVGETITVSAEVAGGTGEWLLEGENAGAGDTWTFTPSSDDLGIYDLSLVATSSSGVQTVSDWTVSVVEVDGDQDGWSLTADCGDTDALVNPGRTEVVGNGIDDDCNSGTSDTPLDSLSGSVSSWGILPEADAIALGRRAGNAQLSGVPTDISGLDGVRRVAGGHRMGLALTEAGALWSWGYGTAGQLGHGSVQDAPTPVAVTGLSGTGQLGVEGAAVTDFDSNRIGIALLADGTAVSWGPNTNGALGTGHTGTNNAIPALIRGSEGALEGATAVASARTFAAVVADGDVYVTAGACGTDSGAGAAGVSQRVSGLPSPATVLAGGNGELLIGLQDGSLFTCASGAPERLDPAGLADAGNPIRLAGGDGFWLMLDHNGTAWTVVGSEASKVALSEGPAIATITAGGSRAALTLADGTALGWHPGVDEPAAIDLSGAIAGSIAVGDTGEVNYAVLSRVHPTIAWGTAIWGAAGVGLDGEFPPTMTMLPSFREILSNGVAGAGLTADGEVWSWGMADDIGAGFSGPGDVPRLIAAPVLGIGGAEGSKLRASKLASGASNGGKFGAITENGQVAIWGSNTGASGDGVVPGYRPYPTLMLNTEGTAPLEGVSQLELGTNGNLALLDDGTVLAFGSLENPCTAPGDVTGENLPVVIEEIGQAVRQVALNGGNGTSFFLTRDGQLLSCGHEYLVGRTVALNTPGWRIGQVEGMGPGSVAQVVGRTQSTLVLKTDGTVWGWGQDSGCSLGCTPGQSAPGSRRILPEQIHLPEGPKVVALAHTHSVSFAIREDGSVLSWGRNTFGQTGLPRTPYIAEPTLVQMPGDRPVSYITGNISNDSEKNLVLALVGDPLERLAEIRGVGIAPSIADTSVVEGDTAQVQVTLNSAARVDIELDFETADGSAVAGTDYTAASGRVTIPAGETSATIEIATIENQTTQTDVVREFDVTVTPVQSWVDLADGPASVSITDDDALPVVSLVGPTDPVLETDEGSHDVELTLTLDHPSSVDTSVQWRTEDGTANALIDYLPGAATVTFPAGETTATISIGVNGDDVLESAEQFGVVLFGPQNATLGTSSATIEIADDEPVIVAASDQQITAPISGEETTSFTISAPKVLTGETVTVPWSVTAPWQGADPTPMGVTGSGEVILTPDASVATVEVTIAAGARSEPQFFRLDTGAPVSSAGREVIATPGLGTITPALINDLLVAIDGPATADQGEPPLIMLTASASGGTEPLSYAWDTDGDGAFDDGEGQVLSVSTLERGDRTVEVQVTDANDQTATASHTLTVQNVSPVIAPIADQAVLEGSALTVSGSFTDPGTNTWTATVDFGSGPQALAVIDRTFEVRWAAPVSGPVTVTVCDDAGACDEVTFAVTVSELPPLLVAVIDGPSEVAEGGTLALSAASSTGVGPLAFAWDTDGDGAYDDGSGVSIEVPALRHGTLMVGLQVTDANGAVQTASQAVTVSNVAPVIAPIADQVLAHDAALEVSGSFTDPGENEWTATVDYGDGEGAQPLALDGKAFTLTHPEPVSGTVAVRVCDDADECGVVTFAVTVQEPTPIEAAILGPNIVDEGGSATFAATGSTGEGDLEFAWDLDGDGEYDDATGETATGDFAVPGTRVIGLEVTDSLDRTATTAHEVTVRAVAPVIDKMADVTVAPGESFKVAGAFTDPGENTWTATVDYGDGPESIEVDGRRFSLAHAYDTPGARTVTVTVCDEWQACGSASFTVTVSSPEDPGGSGDSNGSGDSEMTGAGEPGPGEISRTGSDGSSGSQAALVLATLAVLAGLALMRGRRRVRRQ